MPQIKEEKIAMKKSQLMNVFSNGLKKEIAEVMKKFPIVKDLFASHKEAAMVDLRDYMATHYDGDLASRITYDKDINFYKFPDTKHAKAVNDLDLFLAVNKTKMC